MERLQQEYEALLPRAHALAEGLSETQFNWRPEPGRWSIGECLEHLNLSMDAYVPRLDAAVAAQGTGRAGTFRPRLLARAVTATVEPPYRMKSTTFPGLQPTSSALNREATLQRFEAQHRAFAERLAKLTPGDLRAINVRSPFAAWWQMRVGEWAGFLAAHARRHLWQAEQVRRHPAFSRA